MIWPGSEINRFGSHHLVKTFGSDQSVWVRLAGSGKMSWLIRFDPNRIYRFGSQQLVKTFGSDRSVWMRLVCSGQMNWLRSYDLTRVRLTAFGSDQSVRVRLVGSGQMSWLISYDLTRIRSISSGLISWRGSNFAAHTIRFDPNQIYRFGSHQLVVTFGSDQSAWVRLVGWINFKSFDPGEINRFGSHHLVKACKSDQSARIRIVGSGQVSWLGLYDLTRAGINSWRVRSIGWGQIKWFGSNELAHTIWFDSGQISRFRSHQMVKAVGSD